MEDFFLKLSMPNIVLLASVILLFIYLSIALLFPERFM